MQEPTVEDVFRVDRMIDHWRAIIVGPRKSWVLFSHGTCVVLVRPTRSLRQQAIDLLREWGPVQAGGAAGDFRVTDLADYPGWVIYGHHPDVINYVSPEEVPAGWSDADIGLLGRARRHSDGISLQVVHVEDKRDGDPRRHETKGY